MKAAYNTGLPIATGMLSRTSLSQSLKLAQLLSHENINKEILQEYKTNKPLLLITVSELLEAHEQFIVNKAELIYRGQGIRLYKLPLEAFQTKHQLISNYFTEHKDSLFRYDNYWTSKPTTTLFMDNLLTLPSTREGYFENENVEGLVGKGALYLQKGKLDLFNKVVEIDKDTIVLEVSVWVKVTKSDFLPVFSYIQYDEQDVAIETKYINPKELTDIYKDWIKITHTFTLKGKKHRLYFYMEGKEILADEFLLRPADVDVYKTGNNLLMMNGFPITK